MIRNDILNFIEKRTPDNMDSVARALVTYAEQYYSSKYPSQWIEKILHQALLRTFGIEYPSRVFSDNFKSNFTELVELNLSAATISRALLDICYKDVDYAYANTDLSEIKS